MVRVMRVSCRTVVVIHVIYDVNEYLIEMVTSIRTHTRWITHA